MRVAIVALLVPNLYPWLFALVSCLLVALAPTLATYYSRNDWRIPLWHFFAAALVSAILAFAAMHFVNAVHDRDALFYLWGNVDPDSWDQPNVRANIPLTPTRGIVWGMLVKSLVPVVCVFALSLAWNRYRRPNRKWLGS